MKTKLNTIIYGFILFGFIGLDACSDKPEVKEPFVKETYTYKTVVIGTQEWMAENLRNNTYCDGEPIEEVKDATAWINLKTSAFVYFKNDKVNNIGLGKIYNWYAASDPRNICPCGWHVPSQKEWQVLVDYLGGAAVAGAALKATGTLPEKTGLWNTPNLATNSSGFGGVPNPYRAGDGDFNLGGDTASWWSSKDDKPTTAVNFVLINSKESVNLSGDTKKQLGSCVRCIKD